MINRFLAPLFDRAIASYQRRQRRIQREEYLRKLLVPEDEWEAIHEWIEQGYREL